MRLIAFIGDLDEPGFDYDDGDWNGNVPKLKREPLPNSSTTTKNAFSFVIESIVDEKIIGKQTDWGTTVSPLYPKEIYNVFKSYYSPNELRRLENRLNSLDQEKKYGLVACERW